MMLQTIVRWGFMETVKVSPKYQVVIPLSIRKALKIKPGEKVHVLQYENRIEYIPVKPKRKMRGFLKGIDTSVKRDKDRTWVCLADSIMIATARTYEALIWTQDADFKDIDGVNYIEVKKK